MNNIAFCFLAAFLFAGSAFAGDSSIWTVDTRAEVLKGDAKNVSIDSNGAIGLSPKLTEVFKTGQPYIWSSAADTAGNVYLGTGGDGKVFKVTAAGSGSLLADLAEMNVTALALAPNGDLFAGTSPDGKVYRIDPSGKALAYFDPKEKYIWSLAAMSDGSLAVGTGESGKIYRVKAANATPEASLLFDTSDSHIITLASDSQRKSLRGYRFERPCAEIRARRQALRPARFPFA